MVPGTPSRLFSSDSIVVSTSWRRWCQCREQKLRRRSSLEDYQQACYTRARLNWLLQSSCQKWFLSWWLAGHTPRAGPCGAPSLFASVLQHLSNTRTGRAPQCCLSLALCALLPASALSSALAITNRTHWEGQSMTEHCIRRSN